MSIIDNNLYFYSNLTIKLSLFILPKIVMNCKKTFYERNITIANHINPIIEF